MNDADTEEIVRVSNHGITVEKSFEPDDFPVPAIAFNIRSTREEPVSVRLEDSVPEDVSPENVGFHPKYGAEYWDVEGSSIVFDREFSPGEEYTTVYGLRGGDANEASKFMSEPSLGSVEPPIDADTAEPVTSEQPESGESAASEDRSTIEDLLNPDIDSEEAPETEAGEADEVETGGVEAEAGATDEVETGSDVDEQEAEAVDVDDGKIERGGVDDDERSVDEDDRSVDKDAEPDTERHLETETADRNGATTTDVSVPSQTADHTQSSGQDSPVAEESLLESLSSEIEAADPDDPELVALRDALGMDLTRKSVEARIEHLQSTVSDLEAYTDALEEFLDESGGAQAIIDELEQDYEDTADRIDEIESETETNRTSISDLESDIESRIGGVETEIEELRDQLDSISTDLSDVVEMRDSLANALGGFGPSNDDDSSDVDDSGSDSADSV